MMQVWFLFKIIELTMGTICIVLHTLGFMDKEPLPHIMLFCGTFFGFSLFSAMGAIGIAVGATPPPLIECIINFTASVMYIMSSITSMHYAENDFHLMYLSDFEEPLHPFFAFCRSQSICALGAGAMHLLHAILAFDVLFIGRQSFFDEEGFNETDSDDDSSNDEKIRHIRMYFLSRYIETKLRRNVWFDNLCQRKSPPIRIHSYFRTHRESKATEHLNTSGFDGKEGKRETINEDQKYLKPTRQGSESEEERELKTALQSFNYDSQHTFKSAVSTYEKEESSGQSTSSAKSQRPATRFDFSGDRPLSAPQSVVTIRSKDELPPPILRKNEKKISPTSTDEKRQSMGKDLKPLIESSSVTPTQPKLPEENDFEPPTNNDRKLSERDIKSPEHPKKDESKNELHTPNLRKSEENDFVPTTGRASESLEFPKVTIAGKTDDTPTNDPQLKEITKPSEAPINTERPQSYEEPTTLADNEGATNSQEPERKFPQNWKSTQTESSEPRFPQIHPVLSDERMSSSDRTPGPSRRSISENDANELSQYNSPAGSFHDKNEIVSKKEDKKPKPPPPPPPPPEP